MGSRGSRPLLRLLAGWLGWWVILAAWKIGPALPAILRVTRPDAKGNANVAFGEKGFSATITEGSTVAWEGHITLLKLVLLITVPPLILWVLWLLTVKRPDEPELVGDGMTAIPGTDAERAKIWRD